MMKKTLTVLVPTYNEESNIEGFYSETSKVLDKLESYDTTVLFVNDGSSDQSEARIKKLFSEKANVKYISLSRNYGKETAMIAGIDYCDSDAVVIMDCDLQHDPLYIIEMLKYYEEGYDDIYAKRRSRGHEGFIYKAFAKTFYKILQKMTKVDILENVGDFRLMSRRMVNALKLFREKERYTKGYFSLIGYKKKEILFDVKERAVGESKWNFFQLAHLAINGITSFTIAPLSFITLFGVMVAMAAFIYLMVILIQALVYGAGTPGYASTMIVVLFLGGIQLISIGVLGEYLGRVFSEVKNRPLYFIDEKDGKKEDITL